MREELPSKYKDSIKKRSFLRFFIGVVPRFWNNLKASIVIAIARSRGANIGANCYIPFRLSLRSNKNLKIGDSVIIETKDIDLREEVIIGSHVIINRGVSIITQSHDIDDLEFKTVGSSICIEDHAWIGTKSMVLPNCNRIRRGCIIGAGSVLTKDIQEELSIVAGNPAKVVKFRKNIPSQLITESLQGRDLYSYLRARFENIR